MSEKPREFILLPLWSVLNHTNAFTQWQQGNCSIVEVERTGAALVEETVTAIGESRVGYETDPEVQAFLRVSEATCAIKHGEELTAHV